ncbi:MAG: hypothetical protein WCF67_07510 [Chitinophagaceae bacterium]
MASRKKAAKAAKRAKSALPAKKQASKKNVVKKAASKSKTASKSTVAAARGGTVSAGKVKVIEAEQIQIHYLDEAYQFSKARRVATIHRRKILPKAPKGPKIMDINPTPPLSMDAPVSPVALEEAIQPMALTDIITMTRNVQLGDISTHDTASHVCEPSAAANADVVFYTGNWFAAVSVDSGASFKYIDPFTSFPNPPGMDFCCDQVVHYIKSIDTFVWLLQYKADNTGKNIQRIAYAKTAKVKTGVWKFYNITPASLGLGAGIWLDFPDLAVGTNMLYMSTNCFRGNNWVASAIARIKLTSFTNDVLSASKSVSNQIGSLRVAQHCGTTGYFVGHASTSALRVFSWKESSATPTSKLVNVASWSNTNYSSTVPDGRDWLKRADSRHTGATLAGNELWFAWGSAKGGANARPHAFVQIARINATSITLIENINLWDPGFAIFYAALSTNSNNEVGTSYTIGGAQRFPTHVIGILTGTKRQVTTFTSTRGPSDNKWGDYLTVRRSYPNQKLFCATGYSLQNGAGMMDATPSYTVFGRSSDV